MQDIRNDQSANNQQDSPGAIRPTLFIGLGGTGKEVLLRLRRKFYERFGEPGLPCVSYLWLDTDTSDKMAQGEPMDEIFRAVTFKDSERINLLSGKVAEDLGGVFYNKSQYNHIHNWLYPEVERYGTEISDGAGGVRVVGRMTFFHHYSMDIVQRLKTILQSISTQEVIDKTKLHVNQAEFVATPQVFLVASVAGGTGCGTFLDMVFLLKKLSKEGVALDRRVGILFLPDVYYPTSHGELAQRSYGNAYAALKELEFYTLRRKEFGKDGQDDTGLSIDFEVEWVKGKLDKIQGPPFSVTYLLGRRNEGGIGLETRSELFYMVAESLFLDFMPEQFSTAKRSHYSNVTSFLSGPQGSSVAHENVALSQNFARRYASFGMSKIEIPLDLLKGACSSQLAHEIIQYWARANHDPNIRSHVLEDMAQSDRPYHAEGIIHRFGSGWQAAIRGEVEAIFRAATIREPGNVNNLSAQIEEFERKVLREEGQDPTRWGTAISAIRGSRPKILDELKNDLQRWIETNLEEYARGPRSLVEDNGYLRQLTENLKSYCVAKEGEPRPEFDARKDAAIRDMEFWKREKEKIASELKSALQSHGVAGLALKQWTVESLMKEFKDAEQQYSLARAEAALLDEAKSVTIGAVEFLEKRRPVLQRFIDSLDVLSRRFLNKKHGFLDYGKGVLFIRFFDEEHDWPSFYALNVDAEGRNLRVAPQAEHRRFLDETSGPRATLWDLVEIFSREGETGVENRLASFSERRFIKDFEANPRMVDVLDHPKLKKEKPDKIVEKLVRCALPMVQRDSHLGADAVPVERWAYLGIAETGREPYITFIRLITDQLIEQGYDPGHINILTTSKPWELYLYLVSYAFPLPSLPAVKHEYHEAYYNFYQELRNGGVGTKKFHIPLHLSKEWEGKFDDLRVYGDQEAKEIKESVEALLFGSILKVLDLKPAGGQLEYGYKKWIPPAGRREPLGTRREAIELLRGDARLRQSLLTAVRQREVELSPPMLESYYWLLSYLILNEEQFPLKSPESRLLEEKVTNISDRVIGTNGDSNKLSLDHVSEERRMDEARLRLEGSVEWLELTKAERGEVKKDFPVLRGLDLWLRK